MCHAIRSSALAYALTGEEKYAAYATRVICTWFIDTDSRMNSNMLFAQSIPGITSGRGIGIIDSMPLAGVVDAVPLLRTSCSFSKQTDTALI